MAKRETSKPGESRRDKTQRDIRTAKTKAAEATSKGDARMARAEQDLADWLTRDLRRGFYND